MPKHNLKSGSGGLENGVHFTWRVVKSRAKAAGLSDDVFNHTFRGTGMTDYMKNDGDLRKAQQMANHESPKTTELYDRSGDSFTLDEVERIRL